MVFVQWGKKMVSECVPELEDEIRKTYNEIGERIRERFEEFNRIWVCGREEDIFYELVFCLLTPASRAHSAWKALQNLRRKDLLVYRDSNYNGQPSQEELIADELNIVRFKNKKARYIVEAHEMFIQNPKVSLKGELIRCEKPVEMRKWLVSTVKGIAYKEASHFLRNIGFSNGLAILDRHVLRNLAYLGLIETVPDGLSDRQYVLIEEKMKNFACRINVPLDHLDFVLWYRETGDIFK
jgi:N-glycosylase/DNA lyase